MAEEGASRSSKTLGKAPEPFTGQRNLLEDFINDMDIYIELNPSMFPTDNVKILTTTLYLSGQAKEWLRPYLKDYRENDATDQEAETKVMFSSYTAFKKQLRTVFSGEDEIKKAQRRIYEVSQTGSVADFAAKFRGILATLGWDDEVTIPLFKRGLKKEIQEAYILRKTPSKLTKLIEDAIEIDNNIREFRYNTRAGNPVYPNLPHRPKPPMNIARPRQPFYGGPMPMDLDNAQRQRQKPGGFKPKTRGKLTPAERDHRIQNKLCLYCGKPGHIANDCRAKQQNPGLTPNKRDFGMAEPQSTQELESPPEQAIDWTAGCASPKHTEHINLSWTACYDDGCLIHKSDKDGSGWYPKKPKSKKRKGKTQSFQSANPSADAPTTDQITMDNGKLVVTSYTDTFVHVKTYYYSAVWCHDGECDLEAQHQHLIYDPSLPRRRYAAYIKLVYCPDQFCPHYDPENHHVHQGDDSRLVTVDDDMQSEVIEPTIQMADKSQLANDAKITVLETRDRRLQSKMFSCYFPEGCHYQKYNHEHHCHYDPRDPSRPMTITEAAVLIKLGRTCNYPDCPHVEDEPAHVGHLHWTKNE